MTRTKHRTSFALDATTIERLRVLSRRWNVSQAEVIRRAIELAAERAELHDNAVRERLAEYRAQGRLDSRDADGYLRQVAEDRAEWGRDS
ncbi:MAG: ribbon-helix-helix protein, CopG family [Spirochaetaceae bacterium]